MDKLDIQKIGVIIPFYHGDDFIIECIDSLENALLPENFILQILIVDNNNNNNNNSQSRYLEKIKQYNKIIYLKTKPAIGYGRACNIGAQKAIDMGCDYLCLLNQDTIVEEKMLNNLLETLTAQPELTVCSPMIYDYDFQSPMEMVVVDYLFKNKNFLKDVFNDKKKTYYEIPTIGAACTLMRSSVIKKIGLYDPILYLYGEDFDFFNRLKQIGGKLLVITSAKLAHRASMNETDLQKKMSNKQYYEVAQLIKIIRYGKKENYFKRTMKIAWIFLRNNQLYLLSKYLKNALSIYFKADQYLLPSNETIKKRMASYQKKDTDL